MSPGVKSPCNKICKLESNVCIGCFRTLDEIKDWNILSNEEKLIIINNAKRRTSTESPQTKECQSKN
ncbi:MAG: DUF1289 domain-containing protein [Proteobacteria bacterium]|nr:MAG: DUF1289 domain-containing protein [Pseudomonadota bacterium]